MKKAKSKENKKYTEIQIGKMNQQLNLMKKIEEIGLRDISKQHAMITKEKTVASFRANLT